MERVNKTGNRRRERRKNRKLTHRAPPDGHMFPAVDVRSPEKPDGLPALHMACLYGQLATVQLLLESRLEWIDSRDGQGHRPVHMVLSSMSFPNASSCLRYLLERGADVTVATDSGSTPLHLAASEGLLDCTEILVQAGADVSAKDSVGHTPLDLARIWCRREVARYLKSCMWQKDKGKELQERRQVQALYGDLVDMVKLDKLSKKTLTEEKIAEWANNKGLALPKDFSPRASVSKYHTQCLLSEQNSSNPKQAKHPSKHQPGSPQEDEASTKQPPASSSRPWTLFTGLQQEKPPAVPDLRDSVSVWRDSSRPPQYTTKWDSTPRPAPDLPLDVLQRVLFPRAFPSRIDSHQHFEPQDILEVQRRGYPQGRSSSPWTEVAMHLAEVLEPGHY
ncbi:ankyrin repeat domain-containing protein 53 isoform 2-T2 [Acanthopagrus schlegelii]